MKQPKVFISYSHDSQEHQDRVYELSERLRSEGINCEIDQYEPAPARGWPRWMSDQVKQSDFVLIVCTRQYQRRFEGSEKMGTGAGAKWEGAIITQQLYEAEGNNTKFIPIVFSTQDTRYIPVELRSGTWHIVDDDNGYEGLYRHLTGQPKTVRGAIGKPRSLPPRERKQDFSGVSGKTTSTKGIKESQRKGARSAKAPASRASSLILIITPEGNNLFINSLRVEADETIKMSLLPANDREASAIDALKNSIRSNPLAVAFGSKALFARLASVKHVVEGGREVWHLEWQPDQNSYGRADTEFSMTGQSLDQIAELRARRILLDEKLSGQSGQYRGTINRLNDDLFEHSIRGRQKPQILESPFPGLYAAMKSNQSEFLAAARLNAVLLLLLTNTVERILELELRMQGKTKLAVNFEGQRAPYYSNETSPLIKVAGVCNLIREGEGL
jgi:hypothetical protein